MQTKKSSMSSLYSAEERALRQSRKKNKEARKAYIYWQSVLLLKRKKLEAELTSMGISLEEIPKEQDSA